MNSNDDKPTKVVRYGGTTEKQTIQCHGKANDLYIHLGVSVNIYVSDLTNSAVVVVNHAGNELPVHLHRSSIYP